MLVLGRKVGERILVPQCGLSVTVVAVKGKTIRLAISAPAEIAIFRGEIRDQHQVHRQRQRPAAKGKDVR